MKARCFARGCLILAGLLVATPGPAIARGIEDIHVVALFKDRAVVMVDGKRRLLRTGETSPEGLRLVSAASEEALLEFEGRTFGLRLDGRAGSFTAPEPAAAEFQIFRDTQGMYSTVGSINGMPVSFLVDTGASSIAMNAAQARRLGIDFRVEGQPVRVTTASDVTAAWSVTLDVVKVGDIQLRNISAVVLEGALPRETLLGMSFLGRLELINQNDKLVLRRKY